MRHQHADAPHALGLLRARRERPRGRAPEQRDEVAPFHSHAPVLAAERIAQHCCAAGFQFGLCRLWVDTVEKVSAKKLWN
jgi:hypothetical protein